MLTIGPDLFELGPDGKYKSSIGTLFPRQVVLVTNPPLHALQRVAYQEWFQTNCVQNGVGIPSERKLVWESGESVDLIVALGGVVQIRPELERLDLAFQADELLQDHWNVPKHRIRFVGVHDPSIRQALRERGELWRTNSVIDGTSEISMGIEKLQVALGVLPIYYYNPHTGTRFLTVHDFENLKNQSDDLLANQLNEIAEHCLNRNRHQHPEIAFYGADPLRFGSSNFVDKQFSAANPDHLRAEHSTLTKLFARATRTEHQGRDLSKRSQRLHLLATLSSSAFGSETGRSTSGQIGADVFSSVLWLPGGRFVESEFVFESLFPSITNPPADKDLAQLWDPLARGFIANFIREYGNIEYLNLGRVIIPPSAKPGDSGRRGIYVAEIKAKDDDKLHTLMLRVQRWGVRERLEEMSNGGYSKSLMRAILETEEYVDYTLDRRLGCLQLGMKLPARVNMRRVSEVYMGKRQEFLGMRFPVIYYERDYLYGTPTNQIPDRKLADPRYSQRLAVILGRAAAVNLVVGRVHGSTVAGRPHTVLFDDGDEIIVEGSDGLPKNHIVVDHSAAFTDWKSPSLEDYAKSYAEPVNKRSATVQDPSTFAQAYLEALMDEIRRIQSDYQTRQTAFDGLFKHLDYDAEGSFACRWEYVIKRLKSCAVVSLGESIRKHITVL